MIAKKTFYKLYFKLICFSLVIFLSISNLGMSAVLTEEEIKDLAVKAIEKTGATGQKDMGKVMGELAPQVKGKVDGALVANIVQELLVS